MFDIQGLFYCHVSKYRLRIPHCFSFMIMPPIINWTRSSAWRRCFVQILLVTTWLFSVGNSCDLNVGWGEVWGRGGSGNQIMLILITRAWLPLPQHTWFGCQPTNIVTTKAIYPRREPNSAGEVLYWLLCCEACQLLLENFGSCFAWKIFTQSFKCVD